MTVKEFPVIEVTQVDHRWKINGAKRLKGSS